jgi:hypothetical protein
MKCNFTFSLVCHFRFILFIETTHIKSPYMTIWAIKKLLPYNPFGFVFFAFGGDEGWTPESAVPAGSVETRMRRTKMWRRPGTRRCQWTSTWRRRRAYLSSAGVSSNVVRRWRSGVFLQKKTWEVEGTGGRFLQIVPTSLMSHPEISNFRMWIERIIK